jgi:hypothetical protein
VVPPGSTGAITVTVTSPQLGTLVGGTKIVQVSQNPLLLDASMSTGTGPLTFTWSTLGSPVNFVGTPTPGQILVTFPSKGDFVIQLTITDSNTGTTAMYSVIFDPRLSAFIRG